MSHTADYVNSEPKMLESEKKALMADIEALRKQRKDEKRFLDVDKELETLARVKAEILAATMAGKKEAEAIKAEAEKFSAAVMEKVKAKIAETENVVAAEWKKLEVAQDSLKAEWEKVFKKADEAALAQKTADDAMEAAKVREMVLEAVLKAHKENLDNV